MRFKKTRFLIEDTANLEDGPWYIHMGIVRLEEEWFSSVIRLVCYTD